MQYRNTLSPAIQFYRFWRRFLDEADFKHGTSLGLTGWRLIAVDRTPRPHLRVFGPSEEHFAVWPDGTFTVSYLVAGWGQGSVRRSKLTELTFLNHGVGWGEYQWYVDVSGRNWRSNTDPNEPLAYLSESLLTSGQTWKLRRSPTVTGWAIVPASRRVNGRKDVYQWSLNRYDLEQRLIAQRYDNMTNPPPPRQPKRSALGPRVQTSTGLIDIDTAADQLVALIDVSLPAKSTPRQPNNSITRPKEAAHGN